VSHRDKSAGAVIPGCPAAFLARPYNPADIAKQVNPPGNRAAGARRDRKGNGWAEVEAEIAVTSLTNGGESVTPNGPLKQPPAPAER